MKKYFRILREFLENNVKKFLNLIFIFSSIIFFLPIIQSFYYPIELEARESTLWLHIITIGGWY